VADPLTRIQEAKSLGYEKILLPKSNQSSLKGHESVIMVSNVAQAVQAIKQQE
jgi:predicted ATP-dependent serine protease